MFKNTFFESYRNTMHLWYDVDGITKHKSEKWTPYVYRKNKEGDTNTLFGDMASKVNFNTYELYKTFQTNNKKDVFENHVMPDIQYLVEKYHHIEDNDIVPPNLKVYSFDIEINVTKSHFPSPQNADEVITLITLYDWQNDHYYTFGLHPYEVTKDNVTYIYCKEDERLLLKRFFSFTHKYAPDVYTGWNICLNKKMKTSGFDFPYVVNRTKNLFGDDNDVYKLLSPIKKVRIWKSNDDISVVIAGVSILDYISLYKWYSTKNLERYTLDFVCKEELGETKLEYDGTLSELYHNDWQKYVDYNIRDTELIKSLNDKLGYIELVQTLSLISRAPMESFMAMTQLLEGKLLTYYRRNNLCAPYFAGGIQEGFPAAYVKDPHVGLHDWVISVDIASSYPTAMITLNMSVETYIGRIETLTEDDIIHHIINKNFPSVRLNKYGVVTIVEDKTFNAMLKSGMIAVAPCGTCFKTNKKGVIADIESDMFLRRKDIKKTIKLLSKDDKSKHQIDILKNKSMAYKILLNSMYGITSVPYSRYFCLDMAKAITSCARHTIKQGEKYVNELLNDEIENQDLVNIINELK